MTSSLFTHFSHLQSTLPPDGPGFSAVVVRTRRGGQDIIFHGGSLWGFHTLLLRLPGLRTSVILLSNSDRVVPDWQQLADAAMA